MNNIQAPHALKIASFYGSSHINQAAELKQLKAVSAFPQISSRSATLKPKKAKRPFDLFLDEYARLHAEDLDELPSIRWAMRCSKDVQGIFAALDETQKLRFESLADQDKKRYEGELAKYESSSAFCPATIPTLMKDDEAVKRGASRTTTHLETAATAAAAAAGIKSLKRTSMTVKAPETSQKKPKRLAFTRERAVKEQDSSEESSEEDEEVERKAAGYKSEDSDDEDYLTASEGGPVPGALMPAPAVTSYAANRPMRMKPGPPAPLPPLPSSSKAKQARPVSSSKSLSVSARRFSSSASPFTPPPQILTKSAVKKKAQAKADEKVIKKGGLKVTTLDSEGKGDETSQGRRTTRSAAKAPFFELP